MKSGTPKKKDEWPKCLKASSAVWVFQSEKIGMFYCTLSGRSWQSHWTFTQIKTKGEAKKVAWSTAQKIIKNIKPKTLKIEED